jgi:putative heme-binding domain-containing protein
MGPDLSSIRGQLTLQQLRDALTKERPISPGYRPVQVTTMAGLVIRGIARNEDAFSLQILDQNKQLHLLDKQELRTIEHGKRSLMPHDYDRTLSSAEFQDLIAMLSRQARNKTKIEQPGENEIGR